MTKEKVILRSVPCVIVLLILLALVFPGCRVDPQQGIEAGNPDIDEEIIHLSPEGDEMGYEVSFNDNGTVRVVQLVSEDGSIVEEVTVPFSDGGDTRSFDADFANGTRIYITVLLDENDAVSEVIIRVENRKNEEPKETELPSADESPENEGPPTALDSPSFNSLPRPLTTTAPLTAPPLTTTAPLIAPPSASFPPLSPPTFAPARSPDEPEEEPDPSNEEDPPNNGHRGQGGNH